MHSLPLLIFMYFFEWLIVYSYSKSIYEKRYKNSALLSILFYATLMFIYGYIIDNEFVNASLTAVCNVLCVYVCFKSTLKSSLFHGIFLLIIQCVSEAMTIYVISHITETANNSYSANETIFVVDVILSRIIFFMISRILAKLSSKENSVKSWGRWASLSILPVSSIIILTTFRRFTNGMTFTASDNILCITSITLLMLSNVFVYVIYEVSERNSQKLIELEIINQKNDIDLSYLSLLEKKNEQMQMMAHDYKNHMLAIEAMSGSPEINEYIHNMLGEIKKYNKTGKANNKLLDVILNKYIEICDEKEIRFNINILSENFKGISNTDISSLFNNLLDNAVEAAEQSKDKYIELEIASSLTSYRRITLINSCGQKPYSDKGKLITTKKNKDAHGFGIKIIKKIVDKYQGEIQWEYDDAEKLFKTVVLIPNGQR